MEAGTGQGVDMCGDGSDVTQQTAGRALAGSVKYQLLYRSGGHGCFVYVHVESSNVTVAAS